MKHTSVYVNNCIFIKTVISHQDKKPKQRNEHFIFCFKSSNCKATCELWPTTISWPLCRNLKVIWCKYWFTNLGPGVWVNKTTSKCFVFMNFIYFIWSFLGSVIFPITRFSCSFNVVYCTNWVNCSLLDLKNEKIMQYATIKTSPKSRNPKELIRQTFVYSFFGFLSWCWSSTYNKIIE